MNPQCRFTAANESTMQVHCRDAIHRVSKAATAANESSMQVHGDAMNRVSTMGGDDGWQFGGSL